MLEYHQPALLLITAGLLSAALTPGMRYLATQVGAVARPSGDRWGKRAMPLLGGMAIYLGCVLAVLLFGAPSAATGWALAAASAMMFVGLVDDFVHLRPSTKLMAQLLVACAVLFGDFDQRWVGWPAADAVISIFWIVAITNAFNLLDNMDGLCAGVAAIAAVAFAVSVAPTQPALAQVAAALAGAACGFLLFNVHPASIYMGDTGSLFIGSLLAVLSLSADHGDSVGVLSSLAFPVLLLLIPLFDTLFVTISRKLSARKASVGGRDHTSHRLVAMGLPEPRAVLLLYAFAGLGGLTAVALRRSSVEEATLLTGVLLVALILLGVRLARVNVYGDDDFIALRDKRYTPLLVDFAYKRRVFEVLIDVILASIAYYAAYVVRFGDLFTVHYQGLFLESLPLVIGCELVGLYAAGVYRGIWQHVSLPDVVGHFKGVAFGTVASVLALLYFNRFEGYSRGVFIINFLLLAALVTGSRLSFRIMRELTNASLRGGQPALVYGVGDRAASALRTLREDPSIPYRAVGLLDADWGRVGRVIGGVPVLGVVGDAAAILRRTRAAAVVVSTPVDAQQLAAIERACAMAGAAVFLLEVRLTPLASSAATSIADRRA